MGRQAVLASFSRAEAEGLNQVSTESVPAALDGWLQSPLHANPYPGLPAQTRSKPKEPNSFLVFVAELHWCFQQEIVSQRKAQLTQYICFIF